MAQGAGWPQPRVGGAERGTCCGASGGEGLLIGGSRSQAGQGAGAAGAAGTAGTAGFGSGGARGASGPAHPAAEEGV